MDPEEIIMLQIPLSFETFSLMCTNSHTGNNLANMIPFARIFTVITDDINNSEIIQETGINTSPCSA